ncbi:DNA-3-methyladenine glycosylase II [Roseovarius sp. MBR-38]
MAGRARFGQRPWRAGGQAARVTVMNERIITAEADIAEGTAHLARACPRMAHALSLMEEVPLRRREDGFAALFGAIVSQQVSVAAANAIWARLGAAGLTEARAIAASDEETLRGAGLSRQKARYAQALAEADLDYAALRSAPTETVITTLTEVPGIGVWTAEIYAMFSLGRADVFAPGDLALQEAARLLYDLPERPKPAALRGMAEAWAPWRAVAARLLWAYYRVAKEREGIA